MLDRAALAYQKWGRRQAQLRGHSTLSLDALPGALPVALPEPSSAVDSVKVGLAGAEIADAGEAATDLATSFEAGKNNHLNIFTQLCGTHTCMLCSIACDSDAVACRHLQLQGCVQTCCLLVEKQLALKSAIFPGMGGLA